MWGTVLWQINNYQACYGIFSSIYLLSTLLLSYFPILLLLLLISEPFVLPISYIKPPFRIYWQLLSLDHLASFGPQNRFVQTFYLSSRIILRARHCSRLDNSLDIQIEVEVTLEKPRSAAYSYPYLLLILPYELQLQVSQQIHQDTLRSRALCLQIYYRDFGQSIVYKGLS